MIDLIAKKTGRFEKAKKRGKKHIRISSDRPRMVINRTNKYLYVQVVDDSTGKVILALSSISKQLKDQKLGKTVASAKVLGKEVGKKLKESKIEQISFDRNGLRYHGRIKALADACREEGIKF